MIDNEDFWHFDIFYHISFTTTSNFNINIIDDSHTLAIIFQFSVFDHIHTSTYTDVFQISGFCYF